MTKKAGKATVTETNLCDRCRLTETREIPLDQFNVVRKDVALEEARRALIIHGCQVGKLTTSKDANGCWHVTSTYQAETRVGGKTIRLTKIHVIIFGAKGKVKNILESH